MKTYHCTVHPDKKDTAWWPTVYGCDITAESPAKAKATASALAVGCGMMRIRKVVAIQIAA
ncbi:MAG: hypothetical protein H6Q00_1387 [Holophagaceae bacterium]|nr:hypothetical protein [Holophagaceae bacterium]